MTAFPLHQEKSSLAELTTKILKDLGVEEIKTSSSGLLSISPINGEIIGHVQTHNPNHIPDIIDQAYDIFLTWRCVPAPHRGELIRHYGDELRRFKEPLGRLVSLEAGKILQEGLGEVQEMIDICDYAVGLSRQLYGLTIASERPHHRMMETWHPLGVVGLITPFNFPVAVWAWNFTLAIVCGNSTVWKPSEKTPLTARACQALFEKVAKEFNKSQESLFENVRPGGAKDTRLLSQVIYGGRDISEALVDHPRVPLVSATGSSKMGSSVGQRLAKRFAKAILELGGNNAMIVAPSADLDLAVQAITFSAVGTCGQRCTSLRRLIVHQSIKNELVQRLKKIYTQVPIGNPLDPKTLCGPLIDRDAFDKMQATLQQAKREGGEIFGGSRVLEKEYSQAYYVQPALVIMPSQTQMVHTETFAPILYVMGYDTLDQAIKLHNEVPQGLSSCIFTNDLRESEIFLSSQGSDCGLANVNIGPSGAEIGGAFGGEKETGGGRESGSDAWRNYMRRATNTIHYSKKLTLAQGIQLNLG